ncbi:MAG TPA: allantoinase PuuE [Gammaproteobacteria bacterium]|jgi:putative urate catabolism protein|nr:allantoinase PuuE [Gammaproteobacteria bacterium]HAY41709.1 allantoinase PuuE [Gammaproteobacteria bacterium]|tara:strand:+ start:5154 stop:6080 length:927 start_codon:yes stop_codon:yes gene_type:complete
MKDTETNNNSYPRDMIGYGQHAKNPRWPDNAKIAVQFVLNYEEGGENNVLHNDEASESFLSEIVAAKAYKGVRHMSMESIYEYGSRSGVWRILRLFNEFNIPITIFAVAMAIARNPDLAKYLVKENYDICAHGYRWIDYQFIDEDTERKHMKKCIEIITEVLGKRPIGWYTGRNSPNTRKLVLEDGGFLYDSDTYDDDLPYWIDGISPNSKHLIIPYTLDVNDMRFASPQGFNSGEQFYNYLKDSFDTLYLEGETSPKMMSIGMHARILGRPGRIMAMRKFLQYVSQFDRVWFCTRGQIAEHWHNNIK